MKKTRIDSKDAAPGVAPHSTARAAAPAPAPARVTLLHHFTLCTERSTDVLEREGASDDWPWELCPWWNGTRHALAEAAVAEACIPGLDSTSLEMMPLEKIHDDVAVFEAVVPQRLFDDLVRAQLAIARAGAAWLLRPVVRAQIDAAIVDRVAREAGEARTQKERKRRRLERKLRKLGDA